MAGGLPSHLFVAPFRILFIIIVYELTGHSTYVEVRGKFCELVLVFHLHVGLRFRLIRLTGLCAKRLTQWVILTLPSS